MVQYLASNSPTFGLMFAPSIFHQSSYPGGYISYLNLLMNCLMHDK